LGEIVPFDSEDLLTFHVKAVDGFNASKVEVFDVRSRNDRTSVW